MTCGDVTHKDWWGAQEAAAPLCRLPGPHWHHNLALLVGTLATTLRKAEWVAESKIAAQSSMCPPMGPCIAHTIHEVYVTADSFPLLPQIPPSPMSQSLSPQVNSGSPHGCIKASTSAL